MRTLITCLMILITTAAWSADVPVTVDRTQDGLSVTFQMPGIKTRTVTVDGMTFSRLAVKSAGNTGRVGTPELPVFTLPVRFDGLRMPSVHNVNVTWETMELAHPVYPIQQPWPKNRPLSERPFAQDNDAYRHMERPDVVQLGDPYIVRGVNGIPVILRPVRFNPVAGTLEIAASVTFDIALIHDDRAAAATGSVFEQVLKSRFVDWDTRERPLEIQSKSAKAAPAGRYLIICALSLESGLASYVAHKETMGYSVTLMTTDDTGTSSSAIKEAIQKEYDDVATRPDFVLLVGSDITIPTFSGTAAPVSGANIPRTDLDYSLLDGGDFMPDVLLGRWPANTTGELANLVAKSMDMENRAEWMDKKVVYMASLDQSAVTETTHNFVDDVVLGPEGYEAVKLWTRLGASTQDTEDAFNDGQKLAIYSGHGSETSWADGPVFWRTDILELTNTDYPFVFSFACVTGAYVGRECFAETMVVDEHGGVTCMASSVNSYWGPDDTFEREMFGRYIDQGLDHIGAVILSGKFGFYQAYAATDWPAAYFDQYNLFGDPGLMVRDYAAPSSRCRIFLDVDEAGARDSVTVHLWDSDLGGSTAPVDVVHPITGAVERWTLNRTEAGKYSRTFTVSELTDGLDYSAKVWFREVTGGSKADAATAVLQVDANGPTLTHVHVTSLLDTTAAVTFFLDEPAMYEASLYQGATFLGSVTGNSWTTAIQLTMTGLSPDTEYRLALELTDGLGISSTINRAGVFTTGQGQTLFADNCDANTGKLTHYADYGVDGWMHNAGDGNWFGAEQDGTSDASLQLGPVYLPLGNNTMTFDHYYALELDWDGAVLEYSPDGATWYDLGSRMLSGGYNGIVHNDYDNPLPEGPIGSTRDAWTGTNGGMEPVVVNLSDFGGTNIWIRFRLGSDSSLADHGWYVDNVMIKNVAYGIEPLTFVHVNGDSQLYLSPLGDGATTVTFRAYANNGAYMGQEVVSLDPMEQLRVSVSDLFAPLDVTDIGSIRVTAPDRIAGWVMDDFDDFRGAMRTFTPAFKGAGLSTALVPHVANQTGYWSTNVGFHNLDDTAVNPTFTYQQGACHSTELGLYPAAATGWFDVEMDIFGGAFPFGGMTYGNLVDTGSTTKLAAVESFEKKTIPNAAALTLDLESGNRLIVTHVSNKSFWWTGIALDNLSTSSTAAVQVNGYRTDGSLTESRMYGVRPGDKLLFVTKNEFSEDTAWFDIESDIPLIGYELFGTTNNQSLAGLGIPVRGSKDQVLPVMDLTNDWYGVTLVNPNDVETDVTITLYDDGAVLHTYSFTLDPRQKYVSLLEDLFEGSAADYMDTDLVRIRTDLPVTAFCLQGNKTQTRLGGVLAASAY